MLRKHTQLPITHVIVTHAHWDHIGGLDGMKGANTRVIASAASARQLEITNAVRIPRSSYLGVEAPASYRLDADVRVERPLELTIGGTSFRLVPMPGGETDDSMIIEVPSRGVLFAGDVLASTGSPPANEGSPDHFIDALEELASHDHAKILHGHYGIDWILPPALLAVEARAFRELRASVLRDVRANVPLTTILARNVVPEALRAAPEGVIGYLIYRDMFVRRLHHMQHGVWSPDGEDIEVIAPDELARAVDVIAGGDSSAFRRAADDLVRRGDFVLAAKVAGMGVRAHPEDEQLAGCLRAARRKLMEKNQLWDFFKVTEYSELSATPLAPAPAYGALRNGKWAERDSNPRPTD